MATKFLELKLEAVVRDEGQTTVLARLLEQGFDDDGDYVDHGSFDLANDAQTAFPHGLIGTNIKAAVLIADGDYDFTITTATGSSTQRSRLLAFAGIPSGASVTSLTAKNKSGDVAQLRYVVVYGA